MRLEDVRDYFKLRRMVDNPREICCFRKGQKPGQSLVVQFRDEPPLYLRGGRSDFHMFHRIFLRDEYRLSAIAPQSLECVIDLGANVGIFSSRAAVLARAVFSYEAFPGNAEQLEKNLGARKNVAVEIKAVAGSPGKLSLFMPRNRGSSGAFSTFPDLQVDAESSVEVPSVTLNQIFEEHSIDRCDLLKLDIEGMEYEVLHAVDEDVMSRIRRIHGEYHNVEPDNAITRIDHYASFLESKGFVVDVVPHKRKANHGMFYAGRK